jgi:hypothetical protein
MSDAPAGKVAQCWRATDTIAGITEAGDAGRRVVTQFFRRARVGQNRECRHRGPYDLYDPYLYYFAQIVQEEAINRPMRLACQTAALPRCFATETTCA